MKLDLTSLKLGFWPKIKLKEISIKKNMIKKYDKNLPV